MSVGPMTHAGQGEDVPLVRVAAHGNKGVQRVHIVVLRVGSDLLRRDELEKLGKLDAARPVVVCRGGTTRASAPRRRLCMDSIRGNVPASLSMEKSSSSVGFWPISTSVLRSSHMSIVPLPSRSNVSVARQLVPPSVHAHTRRAAPRQKTYQRPPGTARAQGQERRAI